MKRYYLFLCGLFTWVVVLAVCVAALPPYKTVEEQQAWEKQFDKLNIRYSAKVLTDSSPAMLKIPTKYNDVIDFEMAKTPPTIDFAIVQNVEPEYLPYGLASKTGGSWGGWGDVTKGPDGCFYFSISNHLSYNAESYIVRYDPKTKSQKLAVSLKDLIGWAPDEFGDGKIHADMDIGPDGDLWTLTYFAPKPTPSEWKTVYRGSWLIHHNVFTGLTESLGIPLEGESWPYQAYDWDRNLLFGIGDGGKVIVYDTKERKMVYGGHPPDGIHWYTRCVLIDRETGIFYTTDTPVKSHMFPQGETHRFIRYTRRNNEFTRMNAVVPKNPVTGKQTAIRAHTKRKSKDGAFWCFDFYGSLFKFFPDEDKTEFVDINWGEKGYYTPNMCLSPGGRYLYYLPGATMTVAYGTPVVQYDTITKKKKVLAFVYHYYLDKYGYGPVRPFGIELDEKGESLLFFVNGGFKPDNSQSWFGIQVRHSAFLHLHIPESERRE